MEIDHPLAGRSRRVAITTMRDYRLTSANGGPPTLMLGYARTPEPAIRSGVREIAAAVRAAGETERPAAY